VSHVLLWQPSECAHLIVMMVLCCSRKINMTMMMIHVEMWHLQCMYMPKNDVEPYFHVLPVIDAIHTGMWHPI